MTESTKEQPQEDMNLEELDLELDPAFHMEGVDRFTSTIGNASSASDSTSKPSNRSLTRKELLQKLRARKQVAGFRRMNAHQQMEFMESNKQNKDIQSMFQGIHGSLAAKEQAIMNDRKTRKLLNQKLGEKLQSTLESFQEKRNSASDETNNSTTTSSSLSKSKRKRLKQKKRQVQSSAVTSSSASASSSSSSSAVSSSSS